MADPALQPTPASLVAGYLRAKDENRPHRMPSVFAPDAVLEMQVRTTTIAFPAVSRGLEAITEVLVRGFGRTYENVYTFCLEQPPAAAGTFSCGWLVGMSEKASGAVRVGCGRYDWTFGEAAPLRVARLVITIDTMEELPADTLEPVMGWLAALPYPWCPRERIGLGAPPIAALGPLLERLVA